MAKGAYIGVNGASREIKKIYIGVNGVAKEVKKAWVGVNGVARLFYENGLGLKELPEGSLVSILENGLPTLFYVGKHDYESGLNGTGRTLMVRASVWSDKVAWGRTGSNVYADQALDVWLNGIYKNYFSGSVKSLMGTTAFYYTEGGHTYKEHQSGSTLKTLSRSVFIPSWAEFGKKRVNGTNMEGTELPIASTIVSAATTQWTRSIYWDYEDPDYYVRALGILATAGSKYYARPIFTLPSSTVVNSEPNADGSYTLIE